MAAVRGVYPTWQAAYEAAATRHRLPPKTDVVTFRVPEGVQIHPLAERDYPIVPYMQCLLGPDTRVLNIGGSLAKEYASYRRLIPFPKGLRWHISEVPEVVTAGQKMVAAGDYPGLSFGTDVSGPANILLICGALQYPPSTLSEVLAGFETRPDHIFISRTPMQGRVPRFYTVQNIGSATVPYRIDNETTFVQEMAAAGGLHARRCMAGPASTRHSLAPERECRRLPRLLFHAGGTGLSRQALFERFDGARSRLTRRRPHRHYRHYRRLKIRRRSGPEIPASRHR